MNFLILLCFIFGIFVGMLFGKIIEYYTKKWLNYKTHYFISKYIIVVNLLIVYMYMTNMKRLIHNEQYLYTFICSLCSPLYMLTISNIFDYIETKINEPNTSLLSSSDYYQNINDIEFDI